MFRVIAMDFDGVICDSSSECLLAAWNAYLGRDVAIHGVSGLQSIPPRTADQFHRYRGFVRHMGHMIVPFWDMSISITSHGEFESAYRSVPLSTKQAFVSRVLSFRDFMKSQRREEWLSYQGLYPGIKQLLASMDERPIIVTAKDADSVEAVLEHHGVEYKPDSIFAGLEDKRATFDIIAERRAVRKEEIWFIDDRVLNVIDANHSGVAAFWATWGYRTPEDEMLARDAKVTGLMLSEFLEGPWRLKVGFQTSLRLLED